MPEGAIAALHQDLEGFSRELRVAAAGKWYKQIIVLQGRAAEIAAHSRSEFLESLSRYGVSPFQYSGFICCCDLLLFYDPQEQIALTTFDWS